MSSSTGTVVFNDSRVRAVDVIANEKVGIGTSLPTSNLHVSGNAYVSSNLEVGTANLFVNTTTGRVGVGTTSPQTYMHLYATNSDPGVTEGDSIGTHNLTEYLRFTSKGDGGDVNSVSVGFKLGGDDNSTVSPHGRLDICANQSAGAGNQWGTTPDKTIATFIGDGKVGIGTTQPRAALDIVGNVWINNGPIQSYLGIKAFGGNDVYDVAGYKVHVFTTSGTLIVRSQISVDVLLVGGGGGGGWDNAGGGGAGGLIFKPGHTLQPGEYTVVIGKGGMGDYGENFYHTNGGNSTFDGLTALGGGHGGSGNPNSYGVAGGSGGGGQGESNRGGGAGIQTTSTGISADSRTYGYGNAGGTVTSLGGGGGGGAGGAGGASSTNQGGFGGEGLYTVTVGSTTYNFRDIFGDKYGEGVEGRRYFAGGGAGGNENSDGTDRAGGRGGGGDSFGSDWYRYIMETGDKFYMSGQPNTGGGGAGVSYDGYTSQAGEGGTGIMIIRYQI